jgi:hypothetical protein
MGPLSSTARLTARTLVAALLAAIAAPLLLAGPAQAADAYRYWTYWWGQDGQWEFASTGPADRAVTDGSVEGWLFQVSADAVPAATPEPAPVFADLCGQEPAAAPGQVRVAVVIDFGLPTDAAPGQEPPQEGTVACVEVPQGSTGEQALAAAAPVRAEGGLTCGIGGYPTTGCGDVVTEAEQQAAQEAAQEDSSTGPMIWVVLGAVVLVAAIVVALVVRRRQQVRE